MQRVQPRPLLQAATIEDEEEIVRSSLCYALLASAFVLGSCAPDETICLTDTDCDQGQVCEREVCTTLCVTDSDCAENELCLDRSTGEGKACAVSLDEPDQETMDVMNTWIILVRGGADVDCNSSSPGPDIVGIATQDANLEELAFGESILGDLRGDTNSSDPDVLDGRRWQDACDAAVSLGCDGWVALRLVGEDGLTLGINSLTARLDVVERGAACGERDDEPYRVFACNDPNAVANNDDISSCTRLLAEGSGTREFEL